MRHNNNSITLKMLLAALSETPAQQLALFAFLNLAIIEPFADGLLSAKSAVQVFFHADVLRVRVGEGYIISKMFEEVINLSNRLDLQQPLKET